MWLEWNGCTPYVYAWPNPIPTSKIAIRIRIPISSSSSRYVVKLGPHATAMERFGGSEDPHRIPVHQVHRRDGPHYLMGTVRG